MKTFFILNNCGLGYFCIIQLIKYFTNERSYFFLVGHLLMQIDGLFIIFIIYISLVYMGSNKV